MTALVPPVGEPESVPDGTQTSGVRLRRLQWIRPSRVKPRLLPALGVAGTLALIAPTTANATAPNHDNLAEQLYGGASIGEGGGTFPLDTSFDLMLDAESYQIPESVEIWALSPEGDEVLIGSGATESATYQNPGSPTYPEVEVELIEVELPSSEISASDYWAFAAIDGASDEVVTWTVYPVLLEGDDTSFDDEGMREAWPSAPDPQERNYPWNVAPTIDALTEDTYGIVSIHQDQAILPLDEEFIVETSIGVYADLWLLPPGGEEAVFLPASVVESSEGSVQWSTQISSDDVDYSGIYALVYSHGDNIQGWAPFAVEADGDPLEAGDPGVHESEVGFSDRSIWPVPDSVPGPEEGERPEEDNDDAGEDATAEATGEPAPTQEPEEGSDQTEPAETDQASDTNGINGWVVVLAIAGGALITAGIAYLIGNRRKTS